MLVEESKEVLMAIDADNVHWTCGCHEYVMRQNYWRHSSYAFSQGVSFVSADDGSIQKRERGRNT